jgi:outer membrane lipase/esterase
MQFSNIKNLIVNPKVYRRTLLMSSAFFLSITANAGQNQFAVDHAIKDACNSGGATRELLARCTNYISAFPIPPDPDTITRRGGQRTTILWATTSTQSSATNTQSSEANNNQIATINNRITGLRNGTQGGGLQINGTATDKDGKPVTLGNGGKASTTKIPGILDDRLGIYINGKIGFGDRILTDNELGFNQDTHGATVGMDYRFTDHFLLGTTFSYNYANARFFHEIPGPFGNLKTETYSGAIYASYFNDNGFFVDGIFSGSNANYQTNRRIKYDIASDPDFNTTASSGNQGTEYNLAMTSGFNFRKAGFTITPQIRVDYKDTSVDALNETGGQGYALHTDGYSFKSLQTAPGLQLSYAYSTPWAVIVPMVKAEYIHEFENDSRVFTSYFLQDVRQKRFNIITDRPDRDYIVASAGISAQFMHGISAFVNYDTIQAHSYINNHSFSGGIRAELPF